MILSENLGPRRQHKQTLLFLHQFTTPKQNFLSCKFLTNPFFLWFKDTKATCFGHFFDCHSFMSFCRYKVKFFSPINLFYVNSIIRPKKLEGKKGKVFLPYI